MAEPLIYIVDDDPLSASNLAAVLAQEGGYEVRTFTSQEPLEALAAGEERPDVVITGHKSTGLDGLALLAQLQEVDPELVGLVMTRSADEEATAQAVAGVGPLRHVHKPCSMAELLPRLQIWLERRQLQRTLQDTRSALSSRDQALDESAREVERAEAELRTTHTELRAATERLVQAEQMAAVGRVTAAIAYELTRQLALVGYAEAIKSRVASDPELVELANIIVAAQMRLAAMVDEIHDFTVGDREGPGAFEREPADVTAVVEEALAIMRYDRDAVQRTIERRYQARPLAALHRHKFSQVIINLVSNALQATQPGDVIVVEIDFARDVAGTRVAAVTVSDAGVGMPAEVLARLGEPFFTTRGDRGSGLGVGICMRIVEEHGGRLTYTSEVGRGTTARVTIPLLPDALSGPREDRPA